jgi:hypothetical protein
MHLLLCAPHLLLTTVAASATSARHGLPLHQQVRSVAAVQHSFHVDYPSDTSIPPLLYFSFLGEVIVAAAALQRLKHHHSSLIPLELFLDVRCLTQHAVSAVEAAAVEGKRSQDDHCQQLLSCR